MNLLRMNNKKILLFILILMPFFVLAQEKPATRVMLVKLAAEIDPRSNRFMELALSKAEADDVDYVVIEMDTYGGALNDADDIRTRILNFEKPIYVYINKDAASAGALISIACDSIYMAKGASIGAATVVTADGAAAPDKYQSYMRSIMRSTAEATGRDPRIAEAMVDESLEVDSISAAGQVLTFSSSEAIQYGYCEAQVSSIDEIMERSAVTDYELVEFELSATEKVIAVFLNPFISGILILVIIGGIYFELQTPGIGFPLFAAIIAAILYFIPYYLNGLAANWEILAFVAGILLIAAEIFVIPGFGVAGIAGIVLTVGSLILVMVNNDNFDFSFVELDNLVLAAAATVGGIMGSIVLMFIGGMRLSQTNVFKRIALEGNMDRSQGYTSSFLKEAMVGKTGEAYTVLRPSGKVVIEGDVYDAFTRGNYIEKGSKIIVISDEGTSLKVKELE